MGRADHLVLGDWNAICAVCGFKYKASQLQKRWDGIYVCPSDFENRHPQDFVRARPDQKPLPFTAPEPNDLFTDVTYNSAVLGCPVNGIYCQADFMAADCAIVGEVNGNLLI